MNWLEPSMHAGENQAQEIIIIKRGKNGDHGHHGGAWKIAFADFMTAMMALFLVLWLINATNEETKKAVASYFNPVKLVDRDPSERGLQDQSGGATPSEESGGVPDQHGVKDSQARQADEKEFFNDPFTALAKIASASSDSEDMFAQGPGGGTESQYPTSPFSDPFGPNFAGQTEMTEDLTPPNPQPSDQVVAGNGAPPPRDGSMAEPKAQAAIEKTAVADNAEAVVAAAPAAAGTAVDQKTAAEAREMALEAMSEDLRTDLVKAFGAEKELPAQISKALDVKVVDDGVLISLTDQLGFPMFEIGSAVPLKQAVLAMDGVAKILAEREGRLRIYGHTDARAFSTANDDNWRLSAARAHAAYFMLVRGGIGKERFAQISGFADQQLKDPDNPNADVNRRIEILLEVK